MADDARIRLLPLSGAWETLGADRLRGIVPEGIEASSDVWGPSTLNFRLAAEPGARRPDILPFTPIELEVGGLLCWTGFVWQRPTDANSYSVGCRGWQYHLDDDLYDRAYVHTRLSDFRDGRSFLDTDLSGRTAAWNVEVGSGRILLALPAAATAANSKSCSVVLDMGPDSTAKRVVVVGNCGHPATGWKFHIRGATSSPTGNDEDTSFDNPAAADTSYTLTFTTARRYVELLWANETGISGTGTETTWFSVKSVVIVRDTAYESGGASILKADTVVSDALSFATLLSQSKTLFTAGTFSLPSFETNGYMSPRQVMEAANLVENYMLKIGGEKLNQIVYQAKPSAPIAEVGDWAGCQFDDATVSGEPIYSRSIIDGTGPDGARLVSKRTQTGTLVDRRGFTRSSRIDVSAALTSAVADRINDLWLTEHKTAPFSGTLSIGGNGARRVLTGQPIPPHTFLLYAQEKVRLSNRVDPDTGNWGRDGRIAGVTYNHDSRSVSIAIDDQRTRFDTILARYAALVGG